MGPKSLYLVMGQHPYTILITIAPNRNRNRQRRESRPKAKIGNKQNNSSSKDDSVKKMLKSLVKQALIGGGSILGGVYGGPTGASIGSSAGAMLSRIVGSGDYKVEENSLISNQVPVFSQGPRSVRIRHKEYLTDIIGSIAFSSRSFVINPGAVGTFPWLSAVAAQFQQYKMHGLVFEFVSTSADALNSVNTALGSVIMATQYNSALGPFTSKIEMDGYEFSTSSRPSQSFLHPVECAKGEMSIDLLYVRTGSVPSGQDQRMYDLGETQIATVGMQAAATIGELWVSYDVELLKPRLPPGGVVPGQYFRLNNGPYDGNNTLGILQTTPAGNLPITITAVGAGFDTIFFNSSISSGRFLVTCTWIGTGAVNYNPHTRTLTNLTVQPLWNQGAGSNVPIPNGGTSNAAQVQYTSIVTINGFNSAGSSIQFTGGTIPTTPTFVNVVIVAIPFSDTFV